MKFNFFLKSFLFVFLAVFVLSCDKDFNEIGADFVDNDHFDFQTKVLEVNAYDQELGPVQTNNMPLNSIGYYNNPVFGRTDAHFVTQLELASPNPTFYKATSQIEIDSVYLHIPFFSRIDPDGDGTTYKLDSIYGSGKIRLDVFRSNFYLRSLDPNPVSGLQEQQNYFSSDKSDLEGVTPTAISNRLNNKNDNEHKYQNDEFEFRTQSIKFYKTDPNTNLPTTEVRETLLPGVYMDLDENTFETAVIQAGAANLADNNAFKNHFRGLYFKTINNAANATGAMGTLNFAQGKIVIIYKDQKSATDTTPTRRTITLNMKGITSNYFDYTSSGTAQYADYITNINAQNTVNGDSRLYLKGGAGSMAIIDLFNKQANTFSADLNTMRDENWLINEANLVFYIDNNVMTNNPLEAEPNRIFLYDFNNKKPLIDYYTDVTTNANPKFNKLVHSGIVQKVTISDRGTQYKVRITNHLRNLIRYKDSTNVKLGLVVCESINNVVNSKIKNPFNYQEVNALNVAVTKPAKYVPMTSVMNPLGVVLYGNNIPFGNPDYDKRLRLEIVYTKPD